MKVGNTLGIAEANMHLALKQSDASFKVDSSVASSKGF